MDRHFVEGATRAAVEQAHARDLEVQEKYKVQFLTYWFDEPRHTAFCLIMSPDKETLQKAHDEAHGLVPNEIIEVDPSIVEAFLGRVNDPMPQPAADGGTTTAQVDSAFRAVMFTDIMDSTRMTQTHGDAKALHFLHIHNALTRNALRAHHGREVKHTGDGIMASFAVVVDAVDAAVAIQRAIAVHNDANPHEALHLRVGISAGEPIEEHGDLFGRAVQLAARICAHCAPDGILVAEVVKDHYPEGGTSFHDLGTIHPKGFDADVQVYEVQWRS